MYISYHHLQLTLTNIVNLRLSRHLLGVLTLWIRTRVAQRLPGDLGRWLLVYNQTTRLRQRFDSFALDSADEVVACRDVMNEADDLACGPDLNNDLA